MRPNTKAIQIQIPNSSFLLKSSDQQWTFSIQTDDFQKSLLQSVFMLLKGTSGKGNESVALNLAKDVEESCILIAQE